MAGLIAAIGLTTAAHAAGHEEERAAGEHYSLGSAAFEESDFARAVEELSASLAAKPSLRAYVLRGDANVKLSRFAEARADYEAALRLEPKTRRRKEIEARLADLDTVTAARTRLAVTSDPPGAAVYVDLKASGKLGVTPLVIPTSAGRHRVYVELDGYDPFVARDVNVASNRETPLAVTLLVKGCDVKADASPAGATISVDGEAAAALPFARRLRGGEHVLRFQRAGSLPRQKNITCVIGTPLEVHETLDAVPPGRLVLALDGSGANAAHLRVDGKPAGGATVAVPPGEHRVRVEAPEREPWEAGFHVDSGQEIRLQPHLVERGRSGRASAKWLWTGVGVAIVGVAVGLGVGLGVGLNQPHYPSPTIGDARLP